MGSEANSEHLGVANLHHQPFCFEESCIAIVFTELLQKVCKAEGLHFLGLKWDRASETHEDA